MTPGSPLAALRRVRVGSANEPKIAAVRAAIALGRVGLPEAVAPLTVALSDSNPAVRQMVVTIRRGRNVRRNGTPSSCPLFRK